MALNLFEHRLMAGTISGLDVDYDQWTGNKNKFVTPPGYDGIRFIGEGMDQTIIAGPENSLTIGHGGQHVFEGLTVEEGRSRGVFAGINCANQPTHVGGSATFRGCRIGIGKKGRWAGFSNAFDLDLEDVVLEGWKYGEHAWYHHQVWKQGVHWRRVKCLGAHTEICKLTGRPGPMYYEDPYLAARAGHAQPGSQKQDWYHPVGTPSKLPTLLLEDCELLNHGLNGTGGAAVTAQGWQGHVRMRRVITTQAPGNQVGLALGFDDSGVEGFGQAPDGSDRLVAGAAPRIGDIDIEACGFYVQPGPAWLSPMINFSNLQGDTWPLARSFRMVACAVYGENRYVSVRGVEKVEIQYINVPRISQLAERRGWDTRSEPMLKIPGQKLATISQGYTGAANTTKTP